MMAFRAARLGANFSTRSARFCSRLISASFAMIVLVPEREFKGGEERFRFVVGLGGRGDRDVHTTQRVDLVVLDFREDDLLFDADVVVAAAIEGTAGNATEVTHARQGHGDETIQEFVHTGAAQGHHGTDRVAFADLETGDSFTRLGRHWLLAGDLRQVAHGVFQDLLVGDSFANTHVQGDLGQARHFHYRFVAEFLGQLGNDLLFVYLLQTGHFYYPFTTSPEDLKTRTFLPSTSLKPTRSALPVAALNRATLDT